MPTTTIAPLRQWFVLVVGDLDDASLAVGVNVGSHPMSNVHVRRPPVGVDADGQTIRKAYTHATVWGDYADLTNWYAAGTPNLAANGSHAVGDLIWFHSV